MKHSGAFSFEAVVAAIVMTRGTIKMACPRALRCNQHMMSDWAEREFGSDSFDATQYTHKVLATTAPGSPSNEDISQLIGRLTLAVDDVAGQIRSLVSPFVHLCRLTPTHLKVVAHHEALLAQAATVSGMEGLLSSVRLGINELTQSLERHVQRMATLDYSSNCYSGSVSKFASRIRHWLVCLLSCKNCDRRLMCFEGLADS